MLRFWFDEHTMVDRNTPRHTETHHGEDGKVREREKQRRSVASLPVTTDSRYIVEMGEAHRYGERTEKEKGERKEEKKKRKWRVAVAEKWERKI